MRELGRMKEERPEYGEASGEVWEACREVFEL
jgi:hypothetical protein